ncbi:MAG: pyruvate, phosphate dikinase [Candidatus Melainabacteria bacterium]|nr:MAG: pyruvate, phosphate dikinase [Candidatus Melainabacteria bacterium]
MISAEGSRLAKKELDGKRVLSFAEAHKYFDGDYAHMREALGGKGAGLAEMTAGGVNVPPGLTITTACCREYHNSGKKMPDGLLEEVFQGLKSIESILNKKFGDAKTPLLLSVRSGAKFSMPGMMDTILNLGLNDQTVAALAAITKNDRFAWDSYRRFLQMYGNVVLEISKDNFEDLLEDKKQGSGVESDADLQADDLKALVKQFKDLIKQRSGREFPQDVKEQLIGAIEAVFRSWNNNRAIYYRNLNKIDHNLGTAVNIQAMVFGNLDEQSATGVCFTRDPSSGKREIYGEYLTKAQGEDVVAGTRTPKNIKEMEREMPAVFKELLLDIDRLEKFYKEAQDIEFTIEHGRLYLLQTRTGKRTAQAAVKIAVDMVGEGLITKEDAIRRVEPAQLNQLLLPSFDFEKKKKAIAEGKLVAKGLNASPGAAIGKIVFDPAESERLAARNEKVILVRVETCPDDIHGIVPAQGVLTSRGGMTSHAAVVARGMGKPCVAGCEALNINLAKEEISVGSEKLKKGDLISIDGSTGEVFKGELATQQSGLTKEFKTLLEWADKTRRMKVRANADTPGDAKVARDFGAEGIGLCRTEHMFMAQDRLPAMQEMIMAETLDQRKAALAKLLPMQCEDFKQIFRVMNGLPVTIRLLDPPLHEFLPKAEELIEEVATMRAKGVSGAKLRDKEILLKRVQDLKEANPMMGLRGCRLGLIYPEINKMQVEAIIEAAIAVKKEGIDVIPEIMIPLVGEANELAAARAQLEAVAKAAIKRSKIDIAYKVGTMIELPRACMVANEIAVHAEFFSFGTNDLTQMTFGFSRDDAEGKILQRYLEGIDVNGSKSKILGANPFEVLDRAGVGKLMKMAIEYGLQTRPDLKIGICGEHGGEPNSINFADQIGLDYVSCSPFRIPVARLAAAQAKLETVEVDK